MTTAAKSVAWIEDLRARGVRERPDGSNCVVGVTDRFGPVGSAKCYAWCCATVSLNWSDTFGRRILWTAGVADAINRARRGENGMQLLSPDAETRLGDAWCYDSKKGTPQAGNPANYHINEVVNPGTQDKAECTGGNESDAVRRQWRDRKYLIAIIRPPYTTGDPDMPLTQADLDAIRTIVDKEVNEAVRFLIEPNGGAIGRPTQGIALRLDDMGNVIDAIKARVDSLGGGGGGAGAATAAEVADELAKRLAK